MGDFHALLVEGVPGIGKSTLIDGLVRRHIGSSDPRQIRSFLHLSQSHTYGPLAPAEDCGTLTSEANLQVLDRITRSLEWMYSDLQYCDKPCFVVVDSLHLTHCLRPGVLAWKQATSIDRRLADLGCKLLLLIGSKETILTRTIEARSGSQFLSEYALKFGRDHRELHAHFLREQEQFVEMFGESALEKRMFENDGSLDNIIDEAFAFWRGRPQVTCARSLSRHA